MNSLDESGMENNLHFDHHLKGRSKSVVLLVGALAVALGLTVIIGWYAHLTTLVQIDPEFAPMQYNTALCLLLLGAALCAFVFGWRRLTLALGIIAAVLSILSLSEYLLNANLCIDKLFFKSYITTLTSSVGRMSPITAICIFLMALSMILIGLPLKKKWRPLVIGLLSSVVISLCTIGILGYVLNLPRTYGWGQLTRMALHTAGGLELLGGGLFIIAWIEGREKDGSAPRWLPVPVALGTVVASLILSLALQAKQDFEIARAIRANAEGVQNQIKAQMEARLNGLKRRGEAGEFSGGPPQPVWEDDAANYVHDFQD